MATSLFRAAALSMALALGVSCGGDPLAADAATYHAAMTPALTQNMALAQQFLDIAAQVKKKEMDEEAIIRRWQEKVIPLADGLKAEAEAIEPSTPQLQELHGEIKAAWTARSQAYREMQAAYRNNDADGFQKASKANLDAKLAEERYFQEVNALLEPYGYHLDQFP